MTPLDSIRILGIDPGTNALGFAIIDAGKKEIRLIEMGVLTFRHVGDEQDIKLRYILEQVQDLILQYKPAQMAIEAPFFGKNVQSMLKLGRAQGVAIAAAMTNNVSIFEYSPKKIKQSVTGNGNAAKEQVAAMLETILRRKLPETSLDASDALGAAVCHWFQVGRQTTVKKRHKDWAAFVKDKNEGKGNKE